MWRLLVAVTLASGWVTAASGQALPTPQFAAPAVADSSARAATTGWVRSQNLLSSTGDLSQATVKPAGAVTARTQAARAAETFNVLDWGAVADGATDIGPALNAIAAAMGSAARSNVIYFPAGSYRIATPVTFNGVAPVLQGQGFAQGPFQPGWTGTWIKVDSAGVTPITFSGTNARGARVRDLAFYEVHPIPAPGWAPTANDYVFRVLNALGEVAFDNVLFAGVNRGIYADNSGRLAIKDVQGQFYTTGVEIDDCYDIPRIDRLHAWTFANSNPYVVSYQQAYENTVLLRRVDGIFIGDLFSLGAYAAVHMTNGVNGVTTKAYISNLYADFVNYGVLIDAPGSDFQIANMTSQNNDQTNPGANLPGGHALWVNTTGVTVQVGNLYSKLTAGPAVQVDGNSNRVNIANLRASTFGVPGAGTPAVFVADSGSNASNQVYLGNKEHLQGAAPLVLFNNGSNGGRQRFVMMNDVGGANQNEARAYSAAPGSSPQLTAIGGDANIDLSLSGKGSSGVRLQSSGQTVLRADNANGVADDVLLRAGAGTMNLIAEGSDANVDFYLSPKGTTGGVRLQGNGQTVLRVDNANTSVDDLLVRGGAGSVSLLPEGAEAAIDLYLTSKAAGSVRLQANSGTVLRVDNPGPGTSDLLVRSGVGVMALTVEDAAANANFVINPKGTGLVSVGNCPAISDNSTNLACTSWVRSWVLAQGYGTSTGSLTALTGDVTASGNGAVVATLATANASPGTTGDATHVAQVTTDAKGRVTANVGLAIAFPVGSVAGRGGAVVLAASDIAGLGPLAVQTSIGTSRFVGTNTAGQLVAVSMASSDVTAALGFTPYSAANPSGYIAASGAPVQSVAGRAGAVVLAATDVAGLGPLATQAAVVSAKVAATSAAGALQVASVQGNGALVQLSTGAAISGHCVQFDASGNTIDAGAACGTGSGAGITALTGDVAASGNGSVAATLAAVGAAGTYTKVTTDAKGRVTAGAALASADVTGALGYIPYGAANPAGYIAASGAPVQSVNGATGTVAISAASLGAALTSSLGPLATQPALASQTVVGTTPSGQLVAAAVQGSGAKVQLATGATSAGDCVKYDASGNTVDAGAACGTGSGAGLTALTGDVTAAGTGSVAATLAGIGTAGSYTKVTTDAKGRVVAGGPLAAADVAGALGFAPLSAASPSATGTLSVAGSNGIAVTGAATGNAPTIAATGGDASVDLALAAAGVSGSTRLLANGATVFRADNPGGGNSDLLVRSGNGIVALTTESSVAAAGLALAPKGAGAVTAPTPAATDNSTTVATTAFVKSIGYAAAATPVLTGTTTISAANSIAMAGAATGSGPSIAAVGGDVAVDLNVSSLGAGSVRIKSNGVNVLRTDSPGAGTSDLLVRSGTGTVAFILEDSAANANLVINPKGTGLVSTGNCPPGADNSSNLACTSWVRSWGLPAANPTATGTLTVPYVASPIASAVAAAGYNCATGTLLASGRAVVTSGTLAQAVVMQTVAAGTPVAVLNATTVGINICPPTAAAAFNGLAPGLPVSVVAGGSATLVCSAANTCLAF